jgi:predicted enzyme related to lactoylglutathione lyase
MTEKTSYAPGEPSWIDLSSPDVDGAVAFYGALFGWDATEGNAEFGGYRNFSKGGKRVAGVMPLMEPGQAPSWTTYVSTSDADKTAELVQSSGGTVVAPPMDVAELGRMALFLDDAGTFFGTWQAGTHIGAERVEEEGTWQWAELGTGDAAASGAFYSSVFGWEPRESDGYVEFQQDGRSVAGCMQYEGGAGWRPYFAAPDVDAVARRVEELGGSLAVPASDFPGGRFAVVADPFGATFGLLALKG